MSLVTVDCRVYERIGCAAPDAVLQAAGEKFLVPDVSNFLTINRRADNVIFEKSRLLNTSDQEDISLKVAAYCLK
jgi:hypothetical protein